jgi:hypothetical protein
LDLVGGKAAKGNDEAGPGGLTQKAHNPTLRALFYKRTQLLPAPAVLVTELLNTTKVLLLASS